LGSFHHLTAIIDMANPNLIDSRGRDRAEVHCSWDHRRHGLVSVFDMMELYAYFFVQATNQLTAWEKTLGEDDREFVVRPDAAARLFAEVGTCYCLCMTHEFTSTAQQCVRIHEDMKARQMIVKCGDLRIDLRELRRRFEDELRGKPFFQLFPPELELYKSPSKGWESVIERFPQTRIDIEECSKCMAFERHAAALFHVLLVAEFGIIQVARLFNVAGDKPGWGCLDRLARISDKKWQDKSPTEQQYSDFLKGLLPLAVSIKDTWRHKISHVDNRLEWLDTDFSPEVAREIISATRGFMRRLAVDLPK
jgi:hypothetical protein